MKIYKEENVYDALIQRLNYIFDEFENVIVCVSGGKDSTVLFEMTYQVARQRKRPIGVMFIDQEIEWQATIDMIKDWMYREGTFPKWYQMEFKLFNATSFNEHWLICWDESKKDLWVREKDPVSIKKNIYGAKRFHSLFSSIPRVEYPNSPVAYLSGVRAEESPDRFMAVTTTPIYKWITWGKILDGERGHFTFYPLYDWSYTDIWKAICDNNWKYNRLYDVQFRYGIPGKQMRISNLHHETSVHSLFYAQEAEPETWDKITQRIEGIDCAGKMESKDFFCPDELPFMFKSWAEYRDYLLEKLIDNPRWKAKFKRKFKSLEYLEDYIPEKLYRLEINAILTNDWEFVKLGKIERKGIGYNIKRQLKERENGKREAETINT